MNNAKLKKLLSGLPNKKEKNLILIMLLHQNLISDFGKGYYHDIKTTYFAHP